MSNKSPNLVTLGLQCAVPSGKLDKSWGILVKAEEQPYGPSQ